MSYFEKANDLYNDKEYKKAINVYQKAIAVKENKAAALYNAAVCFIKLQDYDQSIPLLKDAINEKVDSRYLFNLGYCYAMLKNKKKALMYFNSAWALDNDDFDCKKAIDFIINTLKEAN